MEGGDAVDVVGGHWVREERDSKGSWKEGEAEGNGVHYHMRKNSGIR